MHGFPHESCEIRLHRGVEMGSRARSRPFLQKVGSKISYARRYTTWNQTAHRLINSAKLKIRLIEANALQRHDTNDFDLSLSPRINSKKKKKKLIAIAFITYKTFTWQSV